MHNLLWGRKEGDQAPGRKQILLSHNQRNRETSNDMQLIQLNLNHCRAAQDLLKQTVRELGSEVAILSEPYRVKSSSGRVTDSTGKAALWLCRVGAAAEDLSEAPRASVLVERENRTSQPAIRALGVQK